LADKPIIRRKQTVDSRLLGASQVQSIEGSISEPFELLGAPKRPVIDHQPLRGIGK
jgi:hypothetical protein